MFKGSFLTSANVPVLLSRNVPTDQLVHSYFGREHIQRSEVEELAINKYRSSGKGITIEDVIRRFHCNKQQAQRKLKHFHTIGILFTANHLISQGLHILKNENPQKYYPLSIKSKIIEDLKRRNVQVQPTGLHLSNDRPISNNLEHQKAQSFLDVLLQLPFVSPYIHKLQLMLYIDRQYYKELTQKEGHINRSKVHEEIIGRRHVLYTFSPNGTVAIDIKSSDAPFKIEIDEDETVIFSFLGQVRDRLLYHVSDIRERHIPPIMQWVLKGCDLNKDIKLSDICQLTLPDIQMRDADRVFRLYIKSLKGKAVYRNEESLKLNLVMQAALDNIRDPYQSVEKLEDLTEAIKQINTKIDSISKCNCKNSKFPT